tara:strand:+ start:3889 stop:5175 length:1287 start_codon:yes stop_codon:yes gene_type:complete
MKKKIKTNNAEISLIGLGYVGLPLAIEFAKKQKVIGFDINKKRIEELKNGHDITNETSVSELRSAKNLFYTSSVSDIINCKYFIITIPTPVDDKNKPDLSPLKKASKLVGNVLKKNDIVIYESTVYPGATEEVCVPILEKYSSLKFNKDFFCGYSPERINPGDKKHRLISIKKVISGSTPRVASKINKLYQKIIKAGTHVAPSIRVAEAAKVIENTQRDVNIALINEFTIIFNKLNIDTNDVLEAAGTKWNFLPFQPGLVGGHCIGVDPYYLAYKAKQIGLNPEMIISGRKINDRMATYVIKQVKNAMSEKSINIPKSNLLVMGLTFKENCPDIRNTKIIDLIEGFKNSKINVDVYDPVADREEVLKEYKIKLIDKPKKNKYDTIVIAVKHNQFKLMSFQTLLNFCKKKNLIYDLKNTFPNDQRVTKL